MKQLQHGIYSPTLGERNWGEEVNQNFEALDNLVGSVISTKEKCDLLATKVQENTELINNTKNSLQENITNAVNDLQEKIDILNDEKANTDHNHDDRYYTESEIDSKLGEKANTVHNHDDRYYQKTEIVSKLGEKANTDHTHDNYLTGITKEMVTDALGYTPPEQDTNTTYGAGSNLALDGTTFNVSSDPSFDSITVGGYRLSIG